LTTTAAPLLDYTIEIAESSGERVSSSSQENAGDVNESMEQGGGGGKEGEIDFYNDYFVDYRRNGMGGPSCWIFFKIAIFKNPSPIPTLLARPPRLLLTCYCCLELLDSLQSSQSCSANSRSNSFNTLSSPE